MQDLQDKVIITINEDMHCPIGIKPIKSFHLSGLTFYIKISISAVSFSSSTKLDNSA